MTIMLNIFGSIIDFIEEKCYNTMSKVHNCD